MLINTVLLCRILLCIDAPKCAPGWENRTQMSTAGEPSELTCQVTAWPADELTIAWSLQQMDGREIELKEGENLNSDYMKKTYTNESIKLYELIDNNFESKLQNNSVYNSRSQIPTPTTKYSRAQIFTDRIRIVLNFTSESTTILCRGRNVIGTQKSPCRINLSQAEIPPVSLLTSVAAESPKSRLNCTSTEEEQCVSIVCPIDKETKRAYNVFILKAWRNNSLVVNISR